MRARWTPGHPKRSRSPYLCAALPRPGHVWTRHWRLHHPKQELSMSSKSYLIAVIAGMSLAQAHAADEPAGYLVSGPNGAPVTSGYGDCVRTSSWTSDMSYRQCDPLAVVSPAPAASAPEPMLVRISIDALFDFDSALLRADAAPALAKL